MNEGIKVSHKIVTMKVTVAAVFFPSVTFLDLLDPTESIVQYFSVIIFVCGPTKLHVVFINL